MYHRSIKRAAAVTALALLASAAIVRPAHADTRTWIDDQNISMDWSDTDNWLDGEANGAEEIADFTLNVPAGGLTVNLNVDRTVGQLIFGDTDSAGSAGGWTLSGPFTLTLDNAGVAPVITVNTLAAGQFAQISTVLAGANGFTKAGAGTLVLDGNNLYTGLTTISTGVLNIRHASALGAVGVGNGTSITSGAALQIEGGIASAEHISVNGTGVTTTGAIRNISGDNTLSGGVTLNTNSSIGVDAGSLTVSNLVTGGGTLTKVGVGTLVLSSANDYSGLTTISAGALKISNATSLGTTAGTTTISANAALHIEGDIASAENISLNGSGVLTTGAIRNLSGTNTLSGALSLAAASTITVDAGTLTLSGASNAGNAVASNFALTLRGAGNGTVSGTITGTGSVVKNDAGIWTLSNGNGYTGVTTITAGVLKITNAGALGEGAGITTVSSGAALQLEHATGLNTPESISLTSTGVGATGGIRSISGANILSSTVLLTGTSSIAVDANTLTLQAANAINANTRVLTLRGAGQGFISGSITGTTATLTKTGSGTWTLSGGAANTFTGLTTVNEGILVLSKDANFNALGGALTLSGTGFVQVVGTQTIASLTAMADGNTITGSSTPKLVLSGIVNTILTTAGTNSISTDLQLSAGTAVTRTFTPTLAAAQLTLSGAISEGATVGSLTKAGAGTVILSGGASNTYTGLTTVSAGLLVLNKTAGQNAVSGNLTLTGTGSVRLDASNQILDTATLVMGTGTFNLQANQQETIGQIDTMGGATISGTAGSKLLLSNASNTLTATGTNNITADLQLTVGTAASRTFNTASTFNITGAITEGAGFAGSLIKDGIGVMTLNNAGNSYRGGTNINAGILAVGTDAHLGDATGALTLGGGTLRWTGASETLSNTRALSTTAASGIEVTVLGTNLTIEQAFAGPGGSLTKSGTGTLTFGGTAANTYDGLTTVSAGLLVLNKTGNNAVAGNLTLAGAGSVRLDQSNQIVDTATLVMGTGPFILQGNQETIGQIDAMGGASITGTAGSKLLLSNGSNTLTATGTNNITADLQLTVGAAASRTINTAGAFNITGAITEGAGVATLIKDGAGAMTLSNAGNSYSGGTVINGGSLLITNNAHLGHADGDVELGGGTLHWNAATLLDWSSTRSLSTTHANSAIQVNTSGTVNITDVAITGVGGITKLGAGTVVLGNAGNDYSGGTTITAGALAMSADYMGLSTAGLALNGGTLRWTAAAGTTGALNGGRAINTTAAASTIEVTNDAVLTIGQDITGAGGLTKTGVGTLNLGNATYSYNGPTSINAGALRIAGLATLPHRINLGGGVLETTGDVEHTLIAAATVSNLSTDMTWTSGGFSAFGGPLSVDLNGAGATNLIWNSTPGFATGNMGFGSTNSDNVVTFVDNINLNAANRTVSVTDNALTTADRTVFSGIISGTGANSKLIKTGTGLLELQNALNTYEGGTTISGGTLEVASNGALSTGPVLVSGGTLKFTESLTWNPVRTLQVGGTNSTIEVISDKTVTIDIGIGMVGSNIGMIKTGTGTLVFSGSANNTFGNSGPTIVNEGKLLLQKTDGVNAVATNSLVIEAGATVELGANHQITSALNVAGTFDMKSFQDVVSNISTMSSGTITGLAGSLISYSSSGGTTITGTSFIQTEELSLGSATRTFTTTGLFDSLVISSIISNGTLVKDGLGTLTLSGAEANTFTGSVTVNAGTLVLGKSNNVLAMSSSGSTNTITIGNGATLRIAGDEQIPDAATRPMTINGGTFDLQGFNETLAGLITLNAGTITGSANGTLILGHNIVSTGASSISTEIDLTATRTLTVSNAPDELTVSGAIGETGADFGITKAGIGKLTLTGANSYTGNTLINAGVLNIRNNAALGAGAGTTTIALGTALEIQNNITSSENVTANGTGVDSAGAIRSISGSNTLSGTITLANSSIGVDSGDLTVSTAFAGGISSLTKVGAGELILTANNTLTGDVTINGGALTIAGGGKMAQTGATAFMVNPGGSLVLDNTTINDTDRLLAGAGVQLQGGNFTFKGKNGETSSEALGALSVLAGSSVAIVNGAGPGSTSVLTFSSFSLSEGATADFSATGLGMLGAAGSDNSRIFLNGVAAGLMPYATVDGSQLAVYDIANGVRAMALGAGDDDYVDAGPGELIANRYNRLVDSTADAADKSIKGIFLADGLNHVQSGGALTLTTASNVAHIIKSGSASTISGGTLRGGTTATELLAIVNSTGGLTIDSIIADNAGAATSLTKSGAGTMTLTGSDSNTATGAVKVGDGILALNKSGGAVAIGSSAAPVTIIGSGIIRLDADEQIGVRPLAVAGGTLDVDTFTQSLDGAVTLANGNIAGTGAGKVVLGANVTATGASTISSIIIDLPVTRNFTVVGAGDLLTVSGVMSGTDGFAKSGPGELRSTAVNSLSTAGLSSVAVNGGTLRLSDGGTLLGATRLSVAPGGTLYLDNLDPANTLEPGNANRLNDTAVINMNGGNLTMQGPAPAAIDFRETIGGINVDSGSSLIMVNGSDRSSGNRMKLIAGELTRSSNGVLVMASTNSAKLGGNALVPHLVFGTIVDRDGTAVAVDNTIRFMGGWAIHETNPSPTATNYGIPTFAQHSTTTTAMGVQAMVAANFTFTNDFSVAVPVDGSTHFHTSTVPATSLSVSRNYESFTWALGAGAISIDAGVTMTLMSGGLLRSSVTEGTNLTINGLGMITAGNTYGGNHNLFVHGGTGGTSGGVSPGIIINAKIVDNGNAVTLQTLGNNSAGVTLGNAANSYTGGSIINKGYLAFSDDGALGSGGVNIAGGSMRWTGADHTWNAARALSTTAVSSGIDVSTAGVTLMITSDITGAGGINKLGVGTVDFGSVAKSYGGPTTVTAGALRFADNSTVPGLITINGGVIETAGAINRTLGSASGDINWTAGGGMAAFGGPLTVNLNSPGADTFAWDDANFVPVGSALIFGSTTADNVVTFTDNLAIIGAGQTIMVNDNTSTTADVAVISGLISGGALTKNGAGKLVLSNVGNSYAGGTNVTAGILGVSHDGHLGAAGTDVNLTGTGKLTWVGPISGTLARNINITHSSDSIGVDEAGVVMTVTGNYVGTGSGRLRKFGPGILELAGPANTIASGETRILEGTLWITGAFTQTAGGSKTTNSSNGIWIDGTFNSSTSGLEIEGASLGGAGIINGGNGGTALTWIENNGFLRPGAFLPGGGASIGTLAINSPLEFQSGSHYFTEVSGASIDKVVGVSTLTINQSGGEGAHLNVVGALTADSYVIIDYTTLHATERWFKAGVTSDVSDIPNGIETPSVESQNRYVHYAHDGATYGATSVAILRSEWGASANSNWSESGNWTGIKPDGAGMVAFFTGNTNTSVDVDSGNKTVGRIVLGGADYTINPVAGSTIHLDTFNGQGPNAAINVTSNSHTINAQVVTTAANGPNTNHLVLDVAGGASVNLAGGIDNTAARTLTKTGTGAATLGAYIAPAGTAVNVTAGSLISVGLANASLTIGAPVVDIDNPPPAATVAFTAAAVPLGSILELDGLAINGTGLLDLTDNKIQLNYTGASPFSDVRSAIITGRNGGTWDGTTGITSSLATGATAVGIVDNGLDKVTFAYTLGADSNLDYAVDFDDLLVLAQFYGTTGGAVWANGDFNYDTNVDFDDLLLLAQLYGDNLIPEMALMQESGFSPSFAADVQTAFAAVPEPATLGLLAVGALGLLGRRRRQRA